MEMKALRQAIVPFCPAILLNQSASQSIPFPDALLYSKNLVYSPLIAEYWYNSEATIQNKEIYLGPQHSHECVSSQSSAKISTVLVSETLKTQLSLHRQDEQGGDPAWNILSATVKRGRNEED